MISHCQHGRPRSSQIICFTADQKKQHFTRHAQSIVLMNYDGSFIYYIKTCVTLYNIIIITRIYNNTTNIVAPEKARCRRKKYMYIYIFFTPFILTKIYSSKRIHVIPQKICFRQVSRQLSACCMRPGSKAALVFRLR